MTSLISKLINFSPHSISFPLHTLCVVSCHSLVFFAACHGFNKTVWQFPMGFPGGASGKEPPAKAGDQRDAGWIPGLGRSPGGGHGNPLQYFCLENPRGQRSLVGYSPWGHKQSDMAEQLTLRSLKSLQINPTIWFFLVYSVCFSLFQLCFLFPAPLHPFCQSSILFLLICICSYIN